MRTRDSVRGQWTGAYIRSCCVILVRIILAALAAGAFAATPASADTAKDYNVFVFKDFKANSSDVQGRLAAGGNVTINNYSVGTSLTDGNNGSANLVAGGKLVAKNGQLFHGSAVAGSLDVAGSFSAPKGTISTGALPVDFSAEQLRLSSLSTTLAAKATTNGATGGLQWGGYYLNTNSSGLSVFNIAATNVNNFSLTSTAANAIVLINVSGTSANFQNMGFSFSGIDASHVLFNFVDATSITINGVGFLGSVLAPKADVAFNNGNFAGTLIAKSLSGGGEFHLAKFQGDLLDAPKPLVQAAVPEPSTWMTMILGLGVAGFALRRRQRRPLAA